MYSSMIGSSQAKTDADSGPWGEVAFSVAGLCQRGRGGAAVGRLESSTNPVFPDFGGVWIRGPGPFGWERGIARDADARWPHAFGRG